MLESGSFVLSTMRKIPGVIKFYCRTGSIRPNQQWNLNDVKLQPNISKQIIFDRHHCVREATFLCVRFIPSGNRQCDSNSSISKRAELLLWFYHRERYENFEPTFLLIHETDAVVAALLFPICGRCNQYGLWRHKWSRGARSRTVSQKKHHAIRWAQHIQT